MDKEKIRQEFGIRLKKYREAANLSQTELAHACGYDTKAAISKIENGSRDMPRSKVQLAADKLGISPLAFFKDDPEDDASEYNLIKTFRQLTPRGKEDVLNFAAYQLQRELGNGEKRATVSAILG